MSKRISIIILPFLFMLSSCQKMGPLPERYSDKKIGIQYIFSNRDLAGNTTDYRTATIISIDTIPKGYIIRNKLKGYDDNWILQDSTNSTLTLDLKKQVSIQRLDAPPSLAYGNIGGLVEMGDIITPFHYDIGTEFPKSKNKLYAQVNTNKGKKIFRFRVGTITTHDRKVIGKESINTILGTTECFLFTETLTSVSRFIFFGKREISSYTTITWVSVDHGTTVKIQRSDEYGNIESISELIAIKRTDENFGPSD